MNIRKFSHAVLLASLMSALTITSVFAEKGGMPDAHGVDGKTFGAAVSGLAQSEPGAVAEHVSEGKAGGSSNESNSQSNSGGMPAAHGVDGKTFGAAVSDLAQSEPGAVAEHVSGGKAGGSSNESNLQSNSGGMPAAHGVDGKTFGAAVSGLAKSEPGAVAEHVK